MANTLSSIYNADQKAVIGYMNGLSADGALSANNFETWYQSPDKGSAASWGSGATINVYFDPASNWTATERNAFLQSFAMLSGIANVNFAVTTDTKDSNILTIARGLAAMGPAVTNPRTVNDWTFGKGTGVLTAYTPGTVGTGETTVPAITKAKFGLDAASSSGGDITDERRGNTAPIYSYAEKGADGPSTLLHEMGHVLGLGHTGPYNGSADGMKPGIQLNQYDIRQWSIMSYFDPDEKTLNQDKYPIKNTDWDTGNTTNLPTTMMMLDIAALQQLYGAPTSNMFDGKDTFGFNSSIKYTDSAKNETTVDAFDFNVNKTPVITIWDSGVGNTLDLSGFDTKSTIDLNPGTFSSAAGLTNNIAIAYGTRIDTTFGGKGDDIFIVNKDRNNIIDGGTAGDDMVELFGKKSDYTFLSVSNKPSTSGATVIAKGVSREFELTGIDKVKFIGDGSEIFGLSTLTSGTVSAAPSADTTATDAPVDVLSLVSAAFDPLEYEASNPDVARAFGLDTAAATSHYLEAGILEDRSLDGFDAYEYLASNIDVAQAFGADPQAAAKHFIANGMAENRNTRGFDALEYLASNTDVLQAFGPDLNAAERHYATSGYKEGRSLTSFDANAYLKANLDVLAAYGQDATAAENHYVHYGFAEHRALRPAATPPLPTVGLSDTVNGLALAG